MKREETQRPDLVGDGFDVEPLMNHKDLARFLKMSPSRVYDLPIRRYVLGPQRYRWAVADVLEYLERHRVTT